MRGVPVVVWVGFAAFVGLGLPEATLGVTWPSIRAEMGRPLSSLGILLGALTAGYLPASALSGRVVARVGAGTMLGAATAIYVAAMGLYLWGPGFAALALGSFLGGIAAGAIDPGINAHFAVHHGTRAMNLLHACFGIGATAGPLVATVVLGWGGSWRLPYALYAVVQLGLLAAFVTTRGRWASTPVDDAGSSPGPQVEPQHHWASPVVLLSVVSFFVYTGLEVGAGVLAFTLLTESRGLSDQAGGLWAAAFWAGLTIGRLALGVAGRRLDAEVTLRASVAAAVASILLVWLDPGGAGAAGFPLLGFSLAGVFPSLVLLTPRRVGTERTADVVGVQLSLAAIGAAAVPAALGVLAEDDLERIGPALFALALALAALDVVLARLSRPGAAPPPGGG